VRFLLGALVVVPMTLREYGRLAARGLRFDSRDWLEAGGLGVLLFLGAQMQQVGIMGTTVSNAGFLTALYVPLVPVLAWIVDRKHPHPWVWPSAIGCAIGAFLLSGARFDGLRDGDWWVIASTFFWAWHVLFVGRVASRKGTPVTVACVQFLVCGALATCLAWISEPIHFDGLVAAGPAIAYGGVLSVGIAYTLQVVAQRHTPPAEAAVLLSAEILFAAIAGGVYLGERLALIQLAGGLLIFACIVAVQMAPLAHKWAIRRVL
jgi:drug/metabolite transporter (DMT)-like permease